MRLQESELILNERGAIYHVNLLPHELAPVVITVGDPDRVQKVSRYFDAIEVRRQHREFIAHTGTVGSKRITVISTGIGTDNIDIVMNELDALANINLETRLVKQQTQSLIILRIGTCGSLQADIPADSFIASTHAIGIDNLLNYYVQQNNNEEKNILQAFINHTQLNDNFSMPYIASASTHLLKYFVRDFHHGITVTCPGFYAPQGRTLRLGLRFPHLINSFTQFKYGNNRIVNFEMETSAIYGLGRLFNHQCISLNTVVANRISQNFSKDAAKAIDALIQKTLSIIQQF